MRMRQVEDMEFCVDQPTIDSGQLRRKLAAGESR